MTRDEENKVRAIINEAHQSLIERFKESGVDVECAVTVLLFKTADPRLRDWHVAQGVSDDVPKDQHDELFCECAGRLDLAAIEVARRH